jgi:uncharacterized coiled-coil protein SlyX
MKTLPLTNLISPATAGRCGFLLVALACFALSPAAEAAGKGPPVFPSPTPAPTATPTPAPTPTPVPTEADENRGDGNSAAEGVNALESNTTGTNNTATGRDALTSNISGIENTATGMQALYSNTTGHDNTATGFNALTSNVGTIGSIFTSTPYGSLNTAAGSSALASNVNGHENTALGDHALSSNTGPTVDSGNPGLGSFNTATGVAALTSNITGSQNTATGYYALFSNIGPTTNPGQGNQNTATGYRALPNNTTGSHNTADGVLALQSNTTGVENVAIGESALNVNTTGGTNTAVGGSALGQSTGSGNIGIGYLSGLNLTTGNNNIDIGSPGVAGESGTIRIGDSDQIAAFIAGIRGTTTGNVDAIPVLIDSAGQLGTLSSSQRFKKEIKPMDQSSEAILQLRPVTFHYKNDSKGTPQFGLIAEEVADINPDLVVRDENGEIYTVRYDAVNAMLLNEFLKEHRKVEELNSRLAKQEATIAQQQKAMEAVTARLDTQDSKIQKVSDKVELNKPAPQTVNNQ